MQNTLQDIRSIEDFELDGKRVFLRLDLNVPLADGEITDDTRLRAALPTIEYALEKGAKLVVASHLGRPKTEEDKERLSLEPVARYLGEKLDKEVILLEEPRSEAPKALLAGLKRNQLLLLENLRFDPDETKNKGELAKAIAQYIDIYINDAFGASHRAHASIVGLPQEVEDKGIGHLIRKEVQMLDKIRLHPDPPFVAVLGGAKVSDKIPVIEKIIDLVDQFIIGGAMAYTFLSAQGHGVGRSLVEKDQLRFAKDLLERMEARGKEILLPLDHVVVPDLGQVDQVVITHGVQIPEDLLAVDIGPKTIALFKNALMRAKTVFWNGPMGVFETPAFSIGSFAIAQVLAENEATNIVGGGDSAAAARASGYSEQMSHISTGGGASLEYLQGLALPGLEALKPPKTSEQGVDPLNTSVPAEAGEDA